MIDPCSHGLMSGVSGIGGVMYSMKHCSKFCLRACIQIVDVGMRCSGARRSGSRVGVGCLVCTLRRCSVGFVTCMSVWGAAGRYSSDVPYIPPAVCCLGVCARQRCFVDHATW